MNAQDVINSEIEELESRIEALKGARSALNGSVNYDDDDDDDDFDESQYEAINNSSNKAEGKSAK